MSVRSNDITGRDDCLPQKPPAGRYRLLECAVAVSWEELMQARRSGLIHVEYRTGADCSLQSVRVLSSRWRGYWNLVCEYWMSAAPSHPEGLRFHHGYHSENLAQLLSFVMQHQGEFTSDSGPNREGLLQIGPPTQQEEILAAHCLREAIEASSSTARVREVLDRKRTG